MKVIEDKFSCLSLYAFKSPNVNKEIGRDAKQEINK